MANGYVIVETSRILYFGIYLGHILSPDYSVIITHVREPELWSYGHNCRRLPNVVEYFNPNPIFYHILVQIHNTQIFTQKKVISIKMLLIVNPDGKPNTVMHGKPCPQLRGPSTEMKNQNKKMWVGNKSNKMGIMSMWKMIWVVKR